MNPRHLLPVVSPTTRAIFFMLVALLGYGLWLALLVRTGLIESNTPNSAAAALLLVPLLPVALFDLWLRLTWEPELPMLYPPPPSILDRLLHRKYGLYWFPVLICLPLWVWVAGLYGLVVFTWLKDF